MSEKGSLSQSQCGESRGEPGLQILSYQLDGVALKAKQISLAKNVTLVGQKHGLWVQVSVLFLYGQGNNSTHLPHERWESGLLKNTGTFVTQTLKEGALLSGCSRIWGWVESGRSSGKPELSLT